MPHLAVAVFLRKAVLHGFKSFADRTEFEFGSGITSIVGPNGCGKSNLLDAVRWVLGEQSAKSLRGDHMGDVIFAGSRTRKPAAFAEVALTFDNSRGTLRHDSSEVVVGRVLYRSGESEYKLNGQVCRLKDIRELLLDTGVGVDAYSVIEQGGVDQLLQANPQQRREIFEEAAGVSRYKVRRTEAQRKLERTRENLVRLEDVIGEVERRLRSVKLAAGKARSYLEYDAQLRQRRASFALAEYYELEAANAAVRAEVEMLAAALVDERTRLAACDAQAAELDRDVQSHDERIHQAEARLHACQSERSALTERVAQQQRQIEQQEAARGRRIAQISELAARRGELSARQAAEEANLAEAQAAEIAAAERLADLEAQRAAQLRDLSTVREAVERERLAAFDAARRAARLQSELAGLAAQRQRLAAETERLSERREAIERSQAALGERVAALRQGQAEIEEQLRAHAAALRQAESDLADQGVAAAQLDEQVTTGKERRSALLSRLSLLEDLERRREGIDAGTRAVLDWPRETGESHPVIGLVADLLRLDASQAAVLEPVLGVFEGLLVVPEFAALRAALDRHEPVSGPLRVLALDRVRERPLAGGYETTPGFVARACDWVNCAPEHRRLAEHLLGRVIVLESLERALRAADEALSGYTFVTLDGWCVHADGRVSRGVGAGAAGLISRKAEVRALGAELEEVESQLALTTRRRLEVEQRLSDLMLHKQALLGDIASTQRLEAESRGELARAEDERQRLEREAHAVASETALGQATLHQLEQEAARVERETAAAAAEQEACAGRIAEQGRVSGDLDGTLAALTQEITATHGERVRAAERRSAVERVLGDLTRRIALLGDEVAAAEAEAAEAERQIAGARGEIDAAEARRAELARIDEQLSAELLALRERRQHLRQQGEQCGADSREIQRRIAAGEGVLRERELSLRENAVRRESLLARTRDELGIDLAESLATYEHREQDWATVRAEIDDLRQKIARLGNVNLDAIQELDEITPRYEHLVAQRADLQSSIARLEELIVELDAESTRRFAETFEQVRAHFQELFRKLFEGGKADVYLEDPERPLESGIEIVARPPGKEPQTISLLSGGERTMTAIALLMAVFRSRPSPFAILDEVDAALDEANTERFNKLLQEFLSQSQFVVITHSKRTMASADVLYGVTMEEPGVSKRVSVRFEERVITPVGA